MPVLGSAVGLLVLSPLALVTNIAAVVAVCHYRRQFHGTDVAFISLFVSMATQVLLTVPIPAALDIHGDGWLRSELCSFYVWLSVCLRMSELLVTCVMNVHWMCILRFPSGQEVYNSATVVKVVVAVVWFASLVTGLVPVVGASFYGFYSETVTQTISQTGLDMTPQLVLTTHVTGECRWLPQGMGSSFVLFFILVSLATLVVSLVASGDTLLVFHYMRKTAVDKYKAGRFYLPPSAMVGSPTTASSPAGPSGQNTGGAAYLLRGEVERAGRRALPPAPPPPPLAVEEGAEEEEGFGFSSRVRSEGVEDQRVRAGARGVGGYQEAAGVSPHRNGRPPGARPQRPSLPGKTSPDADARRTSIATPVRPLADAAVGLVGAASSGLERVTARPPAGASSRPPGASSLSDDAGRPSARSGVAGRGSMTVHARYNELSLSSELCRLVLCFTLLAAILQHMPFVVLQFVELVEDVEQPTAERTVLWLLLLHSLLTPHVLWVVSRRYRHALAYTWAVYVLRDLSAKEEDPSACTLQSYTRSVRTLDGGTVKVVAKVRGRTPVTLATLHGNHIREGQLNGNAAAVGDRPLVRAGNHVMGTQANGRLGTADVITTDLDDGMTVATNLTSRHVHAQYDHPMAVDRLSHRDSSSVEFSPRSKSLALSSSHTESSPNRSTSSTVPSPTKSVASVRSTLSTPTKGSTDIKRSSSARIAWKEQMMKKHLPAVFVNEAFEADETSEPSPPIVVVENASNPPDVVAIQELAVGQTDHRTYDVPRGSSSTGKPFHYYMHGDFHHDYLGGDSLPRLESESEGGSCQYDDQDIEGILDREHSLKTARHPVTLSVSTFSTNPQQSLEMPHTNMTAGVAKTLNEDSRPSSSQNIWSDSRPASAARSSSVKSESRSEGSETSSGKAARKPLRREAVAFKQSFHPSLQYQKTIRSDPETEEGDSEKISFNNASEDPQLHKYQFEAMEQSVTGSPPVSFYPVFLAVDVESIESDAKKEVSITAGSQSVSDSQAINNEAVELESPVETFDVFSPGDERVALQEDIEDIEDPDDIDTTLATPYLNLTQSSTLPLPDSDQIDTGDVYLNIENVTSDDTFTDDLLVDMQTPVPVAVNEESGFTPRGQTSVLNILMETEKELEPDVHYADHITHLAARFPRNGFSVWPSAAETSAKYGQSPLKANFFLEDLPAVFEAEYPTADEAFPKDLNRQIETVNPKPTIEASHGSNGNSHGNVSSNARKHAYSGLSSKADAGSTKYMITRVGSDVMLPEKAGVVLDIEETSSSSSTSELSVTLEPYGDRRPPWLDGEFDNDVTLINGFSSPYDARSSNESDAFGSSFGNNAELASIFGNNRTPTSETDFNNPFAAEAFNGNVFEEVNSGALQKSQSRESVNVPSELTPSSFYQGYHIFDGETDKGFEDALSLDYVVGNPYMGHFSRFESIEEEPEDFAECASSTLKGVNELEFKTTIVSRPSSTCSNASPLPVGAGFNDATFFNGINGDFLTHPELNSSLPSTKVLNPFDADGQLLPSSAQGSSGLPSKDSNPKTSDSVLTQWMQASHDETDSLTEASLENAEYVGTESLGKASKGKMSSGKADWIGFNGGNIDLYSNGAGSLTNGSLHTIVLNSKLGELAELASESCMKSSSDPQTASKPTVRLTRPSPWPSVESRSNSSDSDSASRTEGNGEESSKLSSTKLEAANGGISVREDGSINTSVNRVFF